MFLPKIHEFLQNEKDNAKQSLVYRSDISWPSPWRELYNDKEFLSLAIGTSAVMGGTEAFQEAQQATARARDTQAIHQQSMTRQEEMIRQHMQEADRSSYNGMSGNTAYGQGNSTQQPARQTGHRQMTLQELEERQDKIDLAKEDAVRPLSRITLNPNNPRYQTMASNSFDEANLTRLQRYQQSVTASKGSNGTFSEIKNTVQNLTRERNNLFWQTVNAIDAAGNSFVEGLNTDTNTIFFGNGLLNRANALAGLVMTMGSMTPMGEAASFGRLTFDLVAARALNRFSGLWGTATRVAEGSATRLFENRFPADTLDRANIISTSQLKDINGRFNYIVTKEGNLVVGRVSESPGGGHIDLAGGQTLQAAGEVKIINQT